MGQSFDGSFTAAVQHGTKQISLPLQHDGNFYATCVKRNYIAAPASGYEPIIGQRTAYTALLKYSDDLSNAAWTKAASTGTASAGTDPEGGTTATKLAEDNTNAAHNASQALTVAAGAMSFGVLAKAAERTQFRLRIYNATDGSLGSTVFNLSTGAITSGTGAIKKLLNGWYWCSVQTTPTVTNSSAFIDLTNDGSTFTYAGTTGSGVLLWRATAYLAAAIGPAVATTSVTRAVTSPAVDADDPLAFLVDEMEPDASTLEMGVARWGREYANVPAEISVPTSIQLTKPSLTGTFPQVFGSYRIFQPDTTLLQYDAYLAKTVTSDTGAPVLVPTGGTYTLTFEGYTTGAIAYNASAATVQTALNALTSFTDRGSCVVTGAYTNAFTVAFNSYAAATVDTSSLTVYADATKSSSVSVVSSGYVQSVAINNLLPTLLGTTATFNTASLTTTLGYAITTNSFDVGSRQLIGGIQTSYGDNFTGGTYTITIFGETTAAIAYDYNTTTRLANIQAALDVLTSVINRGGCVVYGGTNNNTIISFTIVFPGTAGGPGVFTGGTYTITMFGQTTGAINHDANTTTIQAALNALSEVQTKRGGCVVTGTAWGTTTISFAISFANSTITSSPSSLTPAPSVITITPAASPAGYTQSIVFSSPTAIRTLYVAAHGLATTDTLYLKAAAGTYYSAIAGIFTLPDENTITLTIAASASYAAAATITEVGKRTKQAYTPGVASLRASRVTDYYLPGVTLGIATASDVVVPTNQSDGAAFLQAVFAGSGTINYAVGDLAFWRGPILSVAKTTINAADV